MPALTGSPLYTALDVQAALIAKLNADAAIQSVFVTSGNSPVFNTVLDDDPTNVTMAQNAIMAVAYTGGGEEDATMGGEAGGTADWLFAFTALLYFWEGQNRSAAIQRSLLTAEGIVRQALMRYRQLTGVPAGQTQSTQMTWGSYWRPLAGPLSSIFYPGPGFRVCRIGFYMKGRQAYN